MKLLLADDHTLFRDALVQYITRAQPDAVVELAKDLPEALEIMKKSPDQDLVLLDLRMPGMDGMKGFEIMQDEYPDTPVAIMSGVAEPEDVKQAVSLGAVGYFPKTMSGKALLQGIERVLNGEKFIPTNVEGNAPMPSYYSDGAEQSVKLSGVKALTESANINLTKREQEVLGFVMRGASNKEIANELGLQLVTIKLHVRGVCRKLDAKNRTQAAMKAQALGFGE